MRRSCPDDAACHHDCTLSCWRVATCAPLTASGWDDWPDEVKAANPPVLRFENLLIALGED
jgi:putative component of membrane protein insertase Oxa1/YidC/SpoIIIJ protein YidD